MEKVIVSNTFINICTMQVCCENDSTDEEILEVCNRENPSGTRGGWSKVIRTKEDLPKDYPEKCLPVTCLENSNRTHFLILC